MITSQTLKHGLLALALVFSATSAFSATKKSGKAGGHLNTAGWKDLFAPDFSNAVLTPGGWSFNDGVLMAKTHDNIWTKESYGDFVLDLEFKVTKESNSGVFLRTGDIKNPLSALEIQVHDTKDASKYGMVGALYDAKPPSKSMAKPVGEWNHYTITCRGSHVSLVFNGEQVLNVDLDQWSEAKKNPDGTPNKFAKALKDYPRRGPIGLQGLHGKAEAPVWYRNIKIKPL